MSNKNFLLFHFLDSNKTKTDKNNFEKLDLLGEQRRGVAQLAIESRGRRLWQWSVLYGSPLTADLLTSLPVLTTVASAAAAYRSSHVFILNF